MHYKKLLILLCGLATSVYGASEDPEVSKLLKEVLGDSVNKAVVSTSNEQSTAGQNSEVRFLLRPLRSALLSSNAEGSIERLGLVPGASFKKGDVLVKISCNLQEADLAHSKAQKDAAKYEYQANKVLRKSKSVGKLAFYKSEQEFNKAKAGVKAAASKVEDCVTKAPYGGKVAKVYNKQYQYVQVGQELVEIFDDNVFEIKMLVPSSWLSWLKKGYVFKAKLDETDVVFKAEIKRISPKIDSVSKTVPVSASLIDEPPLRLYGMSGVAYFALESPEQ